MKLLFAILSLAFPLQALSGDSLTYKEIDGGKGLLRLQLEPGRMKVDVLEDGKQSRTTLMFNRAKEETTILDHDKKEFLTIDKERMKKLAGTVGSAVTQMKAAMEHLPPAMQKMMKEKMGAMGEKQKKIEPVKVTKAKSGEKVGKWSADRYDVSQGKKVVSQVWTANFKEVGVEKENFEIVRSMSDTFAEVSKDIGHVFGTAVGAQAAQIDAVKKIEGFPVKTIARNPQGKNERAYQLDSAEKKELTDADFHVPEGYKKKSLGVM